MNTPSRNLIPDHIIKYYKDVMDGFSNIVGNDFFDLYERGELDPRLFFKEIVNSPMFAFSTCVINDGEFICLIINNNLKIEFSKVDGNIAYKLFEYQTNLPISIESKDFILNSSELINFILPFFLTQERAVLKEYFGIKTKADLTLTLNNIPNIDS